MVQSLTDLYKLPTCMADNKHLENIVCSVVAHSGSD